MIIAKNDEVKRSRIWRLAIAGSSILIIIIAVYLLMKMFTANPLEGSWESEDGDLVINVGVNGTLSVKAYDVSEGMDVSVKMEYTADVIRQADASDGAYTREMLENALARVVTTFDYNIEGRRLILSEREYGEQLTFTKK